MSLVTLTSTARPAVRRVAGALAVAVASLALADTAPAQGHPSPRGGVYVHGGYGHGGHGHGHWRGGYRGGYGGGWPAWGALGLGIGLGVGQGSYYGSYYGNYYDSYYDAPVVVGSPTYTVVAPPPAVVYETPRPVPRYADAPRQPVIYPRNGQSAAQLDADSNACSEWSGGQPNAQTDADVFRRGIAACMDARGYTVR